MNEAEHAAMIGLAALNVGLGLVRYLAEAGLLSSKQIDEIGLGVTAHLRSQLSPAAGAAQPSVERRAAVLQVASNIEAVTGPSLAESAQFARAHEQGGSDAGG